MGRRIFLVRHGRSDVGVKTPPETWGLHPDGLADIDALVGQPVRGGARS